MNPLRRIVGACWRLLLRIVEIRGGIMWRAAVEEAPADPDIKPMRGRGEPALEEQDSQRLAAGHQLFGVSADKKVMAYAWVAVPGCVVDLLYDYAFQVPHNSVYLWDCFTAVDARNRGLFRRLLADSPKLVSGGPATALVAVDLLNKPSRRAIERAGYQRFFSYYGLRLFGKTVGSVAFCDGRVCRLPTMLNRLPLLLSVPE